MPAAPTAGPFTLDEIAQACGGRVEGDGATIIRFCFPKKHATLIEAGERLARLRG